MKKTLNLFIHLISLLFCLSSNVIYANETSSAVRGYVTDASNQPLENVTIRVTNNSGLSKTTKTDASGEYRVLNLPIGYNYTVTASGPGSEVQKREGMSINLGKTANVDFSFGQNDSVEEIVVTATKTINDHIAVGPSATFGLEELQSLPAVNRNITDILRADPRLYIDESRGDINAVQCGGKNSRFNSLTVDGIRMNDAFGLNNNGYPTERMPFSFDAINQVAVELAPFDVEYGGFSACNINAVTKSGSNDFHGSAFFDYTDDSLRSDSLQGDPIQSGDYDEKRYGVTFGGPILEDTLFFFVAYEKLEGANLFDRGPIGSGAVNEIDVSQAELDEIVDIANTLYQYDPGPVPSSLAHDDEKILVKLDWNINENHRASFTYTHNDGSNFTESDSDLSEFEFQNHLYKRGAELNSYTGTVYSDWTDDFSTEVRVGYLKLDNTQESVGGTDFGEIRVELADVDVYLGGDDSRQSNKLDYDVLNLAFKGKYHFKGHNLTFGYEQEALDVFNLFVQHSETEIRFDGIDNFRNGFADAIYYNNAPSNNPDDAAAVWGYEVHTVYLQDEYDLTDQLTVLGGLRYDWYASDDRPVENPTFLADYGFSNSETVDGEGLIQPRFGFTFDYSDDTTIRGGVGLYSGGNPNVWLSNNYSANNVLQFGQRGRSFGYTDGTRSLFDADVVYAALEDGVPSGPGYGVPQELFDAVAAGTGDNFEINYLDPEFDLPSEWKFAAGLTHAFADDYIFTADFLYTLSKDMAIVKRGDLEQTGTTADGYPVYSSVREASFVLTNSDETAESIGVTFGLSKSFENNIDIRLGYSYSDSEDVNPMTSSVAFSNYTSRAFFDPQEDVASTSNYNIEHRLTATGNWYKTFFNEKVGLNVGLYGSYNTGRPFSVTFDGTIVPYNFTPFLDFQNIVLEPGVSRNEETGSSWTKIDLRISADYYNIGFNDSTLTAFLVVDNLTNLFNDDWGVLEQHDFPRTVLAGTQEARIGDASRYEIRFGVQYNF